MKTICGIILGLVALAAASPTAAQRQSSTYTPLDTGRCQVIAQVEEGDSISWRCPGRPGIPLFVSAGDGRFDLDAGIDNGEWESIPPFNNIGPRVEWRLQGGRPVAVIFRLISADPAIDPTSVLIVETIGGRGRPGCEVARVNAQRADANARARAEADLRASSFRCGRDHAAEIGR